MRNTQLKPNAQLANDLIIFKYRRAKILRAEIDKLERELKPIEKEIYAYMGKDELLNNSGHILIERKSYNQNRFNVAQFKADHLDIYNLYCLNSKTTRYIWR